MCLAVAGRDQFIDQPPIGMNPWSSRWRPIITEAERRAGRRPSCTTAIANLPGTRRTSDGYLQGTGSDAGLCNGDVSCITNTGQTRCGPMTLRTRVIDPLLWEWGGLPDRATWAWFGSGSWDWSHEEIVESDGYLSTARVGSRYHSQYTYGGEGWVRTLVRLQRRLDTTCNRLHVGSGGPSDMALGPLRIFTVTDGYHPGRRTTLDWPHGKTPIKRDGLISLFQTIPSRSDTGISYPSGLVKSTWSIDGTNPARRLSTV